MRAHRIEVAHPNPSTDRLRQRQRFDRRPDRPQGRIRFVIPGRGIEKREVPHVH
jgi:hypothetical protein